MSRTKVGHNNKGEEGRCALSLYSRIKASVYCMCTYVWVCVSAADWGTDGRMLFGEKGSPWLFLGGEPKGGGPFGIERVKGRLVMLRAASD